MRRSRLLRSSQAVCALGLALFLSACPDPRWYFQRYHVSGEFLPDGHCYVVMNGETVIPRQLGRTELNDLSTDFSCQGGEAKDPVAPARLYLTPHLAKGQVLRPGRYALRDPDSARDWTGLWASLNLKRFDSDWIFPSGLGSDEGSISIASLGDSTFVAQFRFTGSRYVRGGF